MGKKKWGDGIFQPFGIEKKNILKKLRWDFLLMKKKLSNFVPREREKVGKKL